MTDLTMLAPSDYPIFDDLAALIDEKLAKTGDDYNRACLKVIENYIAKFKSGGRNSNLWNGASNFETDENFVCFDFQKLLAGKNGLTANAQMLLVLKYLENEVIKNRDYNLKNGTDMKIIVVVDEAHLFIDEKYPIALDFMYQLAKRIRKYNGMEPRQIQFAQSNAHSHAEPESNVRQRNERLELQAPAYRKRTDLDPHYRAEIRVAGIHRQGRQYHRKDARYGYGL